MKNLWSGSSALSSIDQTLQTIRNDVVRLDSQLSQLTQSMAGNQRQRNQIINEIAKVRLSSIEEGDLLQVMSVADKDAADILDKRELALESLNKDIEQLNQQILQRESDREELLDKLNQVSQQIVDIEAQVQKQLEQDDTYRTKLSDATELDSIAQESSRKVEVALEDMAEKAKPYEADKLFMYLYQCGFGTTEYKGGLFDLLDLWMAVSQNLLSTKTQELIFGISMKFRNGLKNMLRSQCSWQMRRKWRSSNMSWTD